MAYPTKFLDEKGLIQVIILLVLFFGLAVAVYLVGSRVLFKSRASLDTSRVEIFGPNIQGDKAIAPAVKLRLIYVPASQTVVAVLSPAPVIIPAASQPCSSKGLRPSYYTAPYNPAGTNISESLVLNCFLRSDTPTGMSTDRNTCEQGGNGGARTKLGQMLLSGALAWRPIKPVPGRQLSDRTVSMFFRSDNNNCFRGNGRSCDNWGPLMPTDADMNALTADINAGNVYLPGICGEPVPSPAPVVVPSPTGPIFPTAFRVASSSATLALAPEHPFNSNNTELDWTLDPVNGLKTIYAQFKVSGQWAETVSTQVNLQIPVVSNPSPVAATPVLAPNPSASFSPLPLPSADLSKFSQLASPSSDIPVVVAPQCAQLGAIVQAAFQQSCSDPKYDPRADINKDQSVNSLDLIQVMQNISDDSWCQTKIQSQTNPCSGVTTTVNSSAQASQSGLDAFLKFVKNIYSK